MVAVIITNITFFQRGGSNPTDCGTPGKENNLGGTPKTPKLRIKRTKTLGDALNETNETWVSNLVVSPVKSVRLQNQDRDEYAFSGESPVKEVAYSPWRGSPAALRGSPKKAAASFSPLSSSSIHKLHTSPLVNQAHKKHSSGKVN